MNKRPHCTRGLSWLLFVMLALGGSPGLTHAQVMTDAAVMLDEPILDDAPLIADAPINRYRLTLQQLGLGYPLNMRGVEVTHGVNFNIRADQVVTGARLKLQYAYSPALLSDLSHINVLVNNEVAASLPLPKQQAGSQQTQSVELPTHLITEFNRLSMQFIGHYTMNCEDPLHSSLWANISNASVLEIETAPLVLPNDLSILPLPFFDRRDALPLNLPFVFQSAPDNATLEAAGALSSWFGALASYRGARFPAQVGRLPDSGHGVILVSADAPQMIQGLSIPAPRGASLSVVSNPNDVNGKLLVVSGRNADELKRAAIAAALGGQTLSGETVVIDRLDTLRPRKPYDAPRWLPTDRPVRLGELIEHQQLNVSGHDPGDITIAVNLPPDLFHWRKQGAPLHLKYRYTPQEQSNTSSFIVRFNDQLVKSDVLPTFEQLDKGLLASIQDDMLVREMRALLPLNSAVLQSRLQLRYMYDYIKEGECRDIIIDNMRGSIDPESTLDLRGYDHFIAMPNLGVFKDAGFPFTRMADLSETAVVMPDTVSAGDVSAYLTLLGYFGKSTGHPATAVTVTRAAAVSSVADKDLLVMASSSQQPLLTQWAEHLPAASGQAQRFQLSDLTMRMRNWFSSDPEANLRRTRLEMAFSGGPPGTYLTGFESPLKHGRSVVVVAGGNERGLAHVIDALGAGDENAGAIQGSLVVVRGKTVESLVADEQYFIGHLSPFTWLQWWMSRHVGGMFLMMALGVLLLAGLAYLALRAKARRRLNG